MKILGTLPNRDVVDRQTLLFTATVPDGIRKVSIPHYTNEIQA